MDENKNPQTQPEAAQDPGKPLSEKRKAALLRYMTILFSAAFVLVLISLILQMHSSEAKISELNAASTSALSNAEALQAENRSLQDEKIALEQENKEQAASLRECQEQLAVSSSQKEQLGKAEALCKRYKERLDSMKERCADMEVREDAVLYRRVSRRRWRDFGRWRKRLSRKQRSILISRRNWR